MIGVCRLFTFFLGFYLLGVILLFSQSARNRIEMNRSEAANDELFEELKKAGISTPGNHELIATDLRAQKALELLIAQSNQEDTKPRANAMKKQVGELSICIAPEVGKWADTQTDSAIWLDFTLDGTDLVVFGALRNRSKGRFKLVERLNDIHSDYIVEPHLVAQLKIEIQQLMNLATPPEKKSLEKLLEVVRIAELKHFGIYLVAD